MSPRLSKCFRAGALLALILVGLLGVSSALFSSPGIGAISQIAPMHIPRASHSATLLPSGKILIAGAFR